MKKFIAAMLICILSTTLGAVPPATAAGTAGTANAAVPASLERAPVRAVHPAGLPAGFDPGGHLHGTPGAAKARGVTNDIQSGNWAGYALPSAAGGSTGVSSQWQQAGLTCTDPNSVTYVSFWVGLDGLNSPSVEQTGTLGVCNGTTAQYYAWYEMYPDPPVYFDNPVVGGELMFGSVVYNGNDSYTMTIHGINYEWTQSVTITRPGLQRSSAEVITEAPSSGGGVLPLADFKRAWYRTSAADGNWLGAQNPTKITMVDPAGVVKATTVGMTPQGGFFNYWQAST